MIYLTKSEADSHARIIRDLLEQFAQQMFIKLFTSKHRCDTIIE
jgi:hypothetical protein